MQGDIVFESQRETKLQKCFKMYLLVICTTLNDIPQVSLQLKI